MRITVPIEIEAPVEQVWALLDDRRRIPEWVPEVVETVHPDGETVGRVGLRFIQRIKEGNRVRSYDGVVTAYEPGRHLAVRMKDERFAIDVDYRLSALSPARTRLDYGCDLVPGGLIARLMSVIGVPLLRMIARRQLGRLKALLEAEARGVRSDPPART